MAKKTFFEDKPQEHTRLKLQVLDKYLQAYCEIMARVFKSIAFIDPYAGAGSYSDGSEGSPLIMCKNASHILEIEKAVCQKVKYFGNEGDAKNYENLKQALQPYECISYSSKLDAKEFINKCLNYVCPKYSSAFFFVDPFNYSFLKEDIEYIFNVCDSYPQRCQAEVVLFLPASNVYRFKTETKYKSVNNFVNSYNICIDEDTTPKKFIERVRQAIQTNGKYCVSMELKAGKNTYALFFIGKNLYGVEKFLEVRDKCQDNDPTQNLFILPDTPEGQLEQRIKEKNINNKELYEWGLTNNFSKKQLMAALRLLQNKYGLKKDFKNCKENKSAYYVGYDYYIGKKKEEINFLF